MKLGEISWLADENVQFPVIEFLRKEGWKVASVKEMGWTAETDLVILKYATENSLGIITQDVDFGELIYKQKEKFHAIMRFWPGHYLSNLIIDHLKPTIVSEFDVVLPFMITINISHASAGIGIRTRQF